MPTNVAEPDNVAAHLPRVAREQPDDLAVAIAGRNGSYARLTFAELDSLCDRAAWALQDAGISKGTRTALMVRPSCEFFALTFALFKLGAIPIMVDPGMGIRNIGACLEEAEPAAFIGITKAQIGRWLFGWARGSIKTSITVGPRLLLGGHSFRAMMDRTEPQEFEVQAPAPGQVAAILFTSGSTGTPKGVVYTHETFNAQVYLLREVYGIAPGEVDLATFPLFALFGPALGMTSVVPIMDVSRPGASNPAHLVAAIQDFECTNAFASPALVDLIGRHCERTGTRLDSIKRVLSAGAPASTESLRRLTGALPDRTEVFTPYGATEALPVSSIGSAEILNDTSARTESGEGVCVGRPVPGVEVAIIAIDDEPIATWSDDLCIPPGAIGEIVVKGPIVTASYFRRESATHPAKIRDGESVRHRMGDVGYLDASGRLWTCGRKSHRVITADTTHFTIPCESIFNTHPAVRRSALVGVRKDGRAVPVICIELEPSHRESAKLTQQLLDLARANGRTDAIETVLYHKRFPVDVRHNAKIFREQLMMWAIGKLGGDRCAAS